MSFKYLVQSVKERKSGPKKIVRELNQDQSLSSHP